MKGWATERCLRCKAPVAKGLDGSGDPILLGPHVCVGLNKPAEAIRALGAAYRGILAGELAVREIVPNCVDPVFFAGEAVFCVFDDAGGLDYTAWCATGQSSASYDDLYPNLRSLDPLNQLSRGDFDKLESILWRARRDKSIDPGPAGAIIGATPNEGDDET